MLKQHVHASAARDVANMLYELGIIDSPLAPPDLGTSLRDGLNLDSQELVSLVGLASSLTVASEPLDEDGVETLNDIVRHVARHRDPWLPDQLPFVMQGSVVLRQDLATVFGYIADYRQWAEVLPTVTRIEPEFDQDRIQIFRLQVEEADSHTRYAARSCRYVNPQLGIVDFTQLSPPDGIRTHQGGWRFKALDEGRTELISYRGFDIADMDSAEHAVSLMRKDMQTALNGWAHHARARICA